MRVLIVEPSKELAEVVSRSINAGGHIANVAHSAQGGISTADKHKPDVVILELLMSGHNGLEFIHEFKSYQDWFDVPVIIYSDIPPEELGKAVGWEEDMNVLKHFYKPTTSLEKLNNYISSLDEN